MSERLPVHISDRLELPLIAAPMLRVSGPELVAACCAAGVMGSFPTANVSSVDELTMWLTRIEDLSASVVDASGRRPAPYAANLIMRGPRTADHLAVLVERGVEVVITSVGSPAAAVGPLHEIGALVLADVATIAHAHKAVAAGADGLVLLTAGAGGQTGWLNPFAFTRAVRKFFDGPIVLAGGMADGHALRAATTLGADLGYMGTRFIATDESMAAETYREMLVAADADDIQLTSAFTGLPSSMLVPSIRAAGLDPAALDEDVTPATAAQMYGGGRREHDAGGPRRWTDVVSAGHSVGAVDKVVSVDKLVSNLRDEYLSERGAGVPLM
jgi:nitronate monooxygenase